MFQTSSFSTRLNNNIISIHLSLHEMLGLKRVNYFDDMLDFLISHSDVHRQAKFASCNIFGDRQMRKSVSLVALLVRNRNRIVTNRSNTILLKVFF